VINTTNSTLNDYGRKIGDVELNVKKQLDDIMTKFQYYNKDFTNISENFQKVSEQQNRIFSNMN